MTTIPQVARAMREILRPPPMRPLAPPGLSSAPHRWEVPRSPRLWCLAFWAIRRPP